MGGEYDELQNVSKSTALISSKPCWCIICGSLNNMMYDQEGLRILVKREACPDPDEVHHEKVSLLPGNKTAMDGLFNCFLQAVKVRFQKKFEWNHDQEPVPFCSICEEHMLSVRDLYVDLKRIKQLIDNRSQVLKEKMVAAEEKFQRENVYSFDIRYYWIRANAIGQDKVGPAPETSERTRRSVRELTSGRSISESEPIVKICGAGAGRIMTDLHAGHAKLEPEDPLNFELPGSMENLHEKSQIKRKRTSKPAKRYSGDILVSRKYKFTKRAKGNLTTIQSRKRCIRKSDPIMIKADTDPPTPQRRRGSKRKGTIFSDDEFVPSGEEDKPADDLDVDSDSEHFSRPVKPYQRERIYVNKETGKASFLHVVFDIIDDTCFKCSRCGTDVFSQNQIKTHTIQSHTKRFLCSYPQCEYRGGNKANLKHHIQVVHEDGNRRTKIPCDICGKPMRKNLLKFHQFTHYSTEEMREVKARGVLTTYSRNPMQGNFQCQQCGKVFRRRNNLAVHEKKHHSKTDAGSVDTDVQVNEKKEKSYKIMCTKCGKTFLTLTSLKHHTRRVHTDPAEFGVMPHACLHCEKRFVRKTELERHIVIHTGIRPFKCSVCPRDFVLDAELKRHLKHHNNERAHKCSECPMAFTVPCHLRRHFATYHAPGSNPKRKSFVRGPDKGVFRIQPSLRGMEVTQNQERLKMFEQLPRQCPHCPRSYLYPSQLKRHIDTHHTPGRIVDSKSNPKISD